MIGCTTKIINLSPDELDTSRIPALAREGADIDNPAILYQTTDCSDSLQSTPWMLRLPCDTEYLLPHAATEQDYVVIGDASTLLVYMRTDSLPLALFHALELLLSAGKTVWLVSVSPLTLMQRPLIYMLYRLCALSANEWTYLTVEQFPSEGTARVYISPDRNPQLMKEDQVGL